HENQPPTLCSLKATIVSSSNILGEPLADDPRITTKKWRTEAMASQKITCLVTLHGIGFEQPPRVVNGEQVANSGYADPLHQHLYK
ncbi:MAG: hypothetical protein ACXVDN_11765, partial [Ktedonobacteraceae bacterium]